MITPLQLLRRIALWIAWHVPLGPLAPMLMGFALGSKPRRIIENQEVCRTCTSCGTLAWMPVSDHRCAECRPTNPFMRAAQQPNLNGESRGLTLETALRLGQEAVARRGEQPATPAEGFELAVERNPHMDQMAAALSGAPPEQTPLVQRTTYRDGGLRSKLNDEGEDGT